MNTYVLIYFFSNLIGGYLYICLGNKKFKAAIMGVIKLNQAIFSAVMLYWYVLFSHNMFYLFV